VKVVVIRDSKIFKAPEEGAMVVKRIKRGETLKATATTVDLKWLVLGKNEFILTDDVAHVATTTPLSPPVRVVVASSIKARNVPAFSGRAAKPLARGEVLNALEVTHDYKWFKIGKELYVPASACVLHESEGKNLLITLKARNSPLPQNPTALVHPAMRPLAPPDASTLNDSPMEQRKITEQVTPDKVRQLVEQQQKKKKHTPQAIEMEPVQTITHIRVTQDTPVYYKPSLNASIVKELPKGTLVSAQAIDSGLKWIQIGKEEYIEIEHTNGGTNY
jgi:hypothetical protein